MRRTLATILGIALLMVMVPPACAQAKPDTEVQPDTEEQKVLYALGLAFSQRLSGFDFTAEELSMIQVGMADGVLGRDAQVELEVYGPKIDAMMRGRQEAAAARETEAGVAFLADTAKEEGAVTTDSGMIYFELEPGTGAAPGATETVRIHYHGTLRDGKVFDSSVDSGEPATFALNAVITCFSEGLQKMKVGGKSRLVCPPDIAYGDRGAPPMIPAGAALSFEIELLEIVETPAGHSMLGHDD